MDKTDIFVILQSCVFAFEISEEDVVNLGYDKRLVRIGFKLKSWLNKLVLKEEKLNDI